MKVIKKCLGKFLSLVGRFVLKFKIKNVEIIFKKMVSKKW